MYNTYTSTVRYVYLVLSVSTLRIYYFPVPSPSCTHEPTHSIYYYRSLPATSVPAPSPLFSSFRVPINHLILSLCMLSDVPPVERGHAVPLLPSSTDGPPRVSSIVSAVSNFYSLQASGGDSLASQSSREPVAERISSQEGGLLYICRVQVQVEPLSLLPPLPSPSSRVRELDTIYALF